MTASRARPGLAVVDYWRGALHPSGSTPKRRRYRPPDTDRAPPGRGLRQPEHAAGLVEASVSPNTRRAYAGALRRLDAWLDGRELHDVTLAA